MKYSIAVVYCTVLYCTVPLRYWPEIANLSNYKLHTASIPYRIHSKFSTSVSRWNLHPQNGLNVVHGYLENISTVFLKNFRFQWLMRNLRRQPFPMPLTMWISGL